MWMITTGTIFLLTISVRHDGYTFLFLTPIELSRQVSRKQRLHIAVDTIEDVINLVGV